MNIEKRLEIGIAAAVSAGGLLMQHFGDKLQVSRKESYRDVVTDIDEMAEDHIIRKIREREPKAAILTEEGKGDRTLPNDQFWIIDALDGTVNYVNQVPFYGVSVAYVQAGRPVMGVIFSPQANDLYYGCIGVGSFKNQSVIRIADKPPTEGLFSVAFSGRNYDPDGRKSEFLLMGEINDSTRGCLRTGSASINLAFLAEGKLSGCWGKANKFWDVAAGLCLAELAGAVVRFELDGLGGREKVFANYLACVPSCWPFLSERAGLVLNFSGR